MQYNPSNWYWKITGLANQVWSSGTPGLVSNTDSTYLTWLTSNSNHIYTLTWTELYDIMATYAPAAALAIGATQISSLTPQQAVSYLFNAGCQIQSTGTPALNSTYSIDPTAQSRITSLVAGINAGKPLPGGGSTFVYLDMSGNPQIFSAPNFVNFATGIEDYVYQIFATESILLAGGSATFPTQPVIID